MAKKICVIYSDGACSGNPGPGGWAFVAALEDVSVYEKSGYDPQTTNNRMELGSALEGLKWLTRTLNSYDEEDLQNNYDFIFYSDSVYFLRGLTDWVHGWKKRGWKNSKNEEVTNQDLWEALDREYFFLKKKITLNLRFVKGHAGHYGNERCDELAVLASQGRPSSNQIPAENYNKKIFILPPVVPIPDVKFTKPTNTESTYYLSMVNGVVVKHKTWSECEKSVKGVSGAKFKKVNSEAEEVEVLKSWGK